MTRGRGPRRFREQRWLVDEALRVRDVEFDQPRLGYHLGVVGDDLAPAEMIALRAGINKLSDFVPVVRAFAERRERRVPGVGPCPASSRARTRSSSRPRRHEVTGRSSSPTAVTLYAGARHSMTEASSVALGPGWRTMQVEWLHDRLRGRPADPSRHLVLPSGQVVGAG